GRFCWHLDRRVFETCGLTELRTFFHFMNERAVAPDEPLFVAEHGRAAGERPTRNGLLQVIRRLARTAKFACTGVKCIPHTFRYTFSIMYLKAGWHQFSL